MSVVQVQAQFVSRLIEAVRQENGGIRLLAFVEKITPILQAVPILQVAVDRETIGIPAVASAAPTPLQPVVI